MTLTSRVVLATDHLRGSLTPEEASQVVAARLRSVGADIRTACPPGVAGGPSFLSMPLTTNPFTLPPNANDRHRTPGRVRGTVSVG